MTGKLQQTRVGSFDQSHILVIGNRNWSLHLHVIWRCGCALQDTAGIHLVIYMWADPIEVTEFTDSSEWDRRAFSMFCPAPILALIYILLSSWIV